MASNNCFNTLCCNNKASNCCRNNKCCDPCRIRYLTTNEIIKDAICDPCTLFCGKIVPIAPSPIPPIPPLPPPVPPVPPGMIVIGTGRFVGIQIPVPNTIIPQISFVGVTDGIGVAHVNNSPFIELLPNTMYNYSYAIRITTTNMIMPNMVESQLTLLLGIVNNIIPGSTAVLNNILGTVTLTRSGSFVTGDFPAPEIFLGVDNLNTRVAYTLDDTLLMIEAVR